MQGSLDMTRGDPRSHILAFALPMIATSTLQQLYNVVDSAVVGQLLGTEAFASVGAAGWLYWFGLNILIGLTQGFSIVMAQRHGASDTKGIHSALTASACLVLGATALLTLAGVLSARPVLLLLNTPVNVIDGAVVYLRYLFSGLLVTGMYNLTAAALRAFGDSKTPLIAMVIASLMNLGMNLLFIKAFALGIMGVAIATLLAQVLALCYCLLIIRHRGLLHRDGGPWRTDRHTLKRLCLLGGPLAVRNGVLSIAGLAVQYVINGFGYLFMTGMTAARKLTDITEQVGVGLNGAIALYVGQNVGAGQPARVREGMRTAVRIALVCAALAGAALIFLGKPLLRLFITDGDYAADAVAYGQAYLRVIGLTLILRYGMQILRAAMEGIGDTLTPMLTSAIELGVRVLVAFFLSMLVGAMGIYVAEPAGWLVAGIVLVLTYCIHMTRMH